MGFKSIAQMDKFRELLADGKITQAQFDEWLDSTPDPTKLPARITVAKPKRSQPSSLKFPTCA
jgi:hypothetical protein